MAALPEVIRFRGILERIFNSWTALKMCVEHGMGEKKSDTRSGHQKAIAFMEETFIFCTQYETRSQYEIEDFLEDAMNDQFDTICDDDSVVLIASDLVRFMALCRDHQYDVIDRELAALPAITQWLTPQFRVQYAEANDSSDDDDEESGDEDDAMDDTPTDTPTPSRLSAAARRAPAAKSASSMDTDEDGWTTVQSRRRH